MSESEINKALSNIRSELDFLLDHKVISKDDYRKIDKTLPGKYESHYSEYVEAIYQFDPQQAGDLALHVGDIVEVLEKPSAEWYKGRLHGHEGMFPSNYTKPSDGKKHHSIFGSHKQAAAAPPQPVVVQQPPPQPVVVQQQAPAKQHHEHHVGAHLKSFGSKLGNAAIFGAGATMGSDIVNSIF